MVAGERCGAGLSHCPGGQGCEEVADSLSKVLSAWQGGSEGQLQT